MRPFLIFEILVIRFLFGTQKKVSPLKREPTNREGKPQELNVEPTGMAQEIKAETGTMINVNEQPPATQFTTNDTTKHNARVSTGWGP